MVFKGQHSRTLIVKHHAMAESSVQLAGPEQLLRQWRALLAAAAAGAKLLQSCPALCLHRRQPTRLPHPWDSPGKNTGVGCHFLLQYMKVKSESEVAQSCLTPSDPTDCSLPDSSIHGIFQARVLEWVAIAFSGTLSTLVHIFTG